MFNRKTLAFIAVAAVALSAFAQTSAAAADKPNPEAEKIAKINERIAVMSAQLAELEMRAKLTAKQVEIEKSRESSQGLIDTNFIPTVREIGGVDGHIWAVLNVAGGNTQTVRIGDVINSWRVTQISRDAVTVQRGNDEMRLSFGLSPVPAHDQIQGAVNVAMPPFPMR